MEKAPTNEVQKLLELEEKHFDIAEGFIQKKLNQRLKDLWSEQFEQNPTQFFSPEARERAFCGIIRV